MKADKSRKNCGIFLGILFVICHAIADFFASGAVFKMFTSYKKAESDYNNSATVTLVRRLNSKIRPTLNTLNYLSLKTTVGT